MSTVPDLHTMTTIGVVTSPRTKLLDDIKPYVGEFGPAVPSASPSG